MNQKWQTIKLFLSSTFLDMHTERDHLLRVVFPELKARCRQKRINLIEIDLRWGVTQKEAEDGKVLDICLDEVDACRPFFVGLLGHRYGWVSEGDTHSITAKEIYHGVLHHFVPRQIMARDFKNIIEDQSLSEVQKQALENGYQWLGEKGKYGLKDDCPDQAIIQSIFKPFSSYQPDRSFFFFRQEALTRQLMGDKQDDYLGSIENRTKLADLKAEIKAAGLPVFEYDEIEAFGQQLLETLWERLQQEAENVPPTDWLAEEAEFHELFMADRMQRFVGRQAMLDEMQRFCQRADEPNIFVITGEPGSGKSTLMARFVENFSEQHPSQLMIAHFIGASPTSTNLRLSLRRICALLDKAIGAEENLPDDINELIQGFSERLEKTERQVVIVLDAVNQFEMRDNPHAMHWLPQKMPNNIRVVISTLPSDAYDALLRRGVKPAVSLIPLGGALIRTLSGHTDYVQAVAVTPDGSRVVSGSADNTLKVWDLDSGQLLHTLNEHSARVCAVTITPNGEKIISSSSDNTLKIWDLASGQLLHTLSGHSHWVKVVTVTPDGDRVVSGSRDGTLKVWDLANGQLLHTLRGHSDYVWAATVTPDGERVVSGSLDKTLKVWDLARKELGAALLKSYPLDVHENPIIKFVNQMLYRAIKECASDLHFEPYEKFYRVRFRIDGVLRVVANPPIGLARKIAACIKVMSHLDVSCRVVPQDGWIKFKLSKDEAIDFSVSTSPTLWGEKVVIKIINDSSVILNLDALGFEEEQKRLYLEALTNSSGMILISGPHDIGKTVTFYTGINLLNKENVNIYTIHHNGEEINIPGINKIELQDYSDYPIFLRTFLRQIPDIILLEEMGSLEIASLAFIASNRCLVMSSCFTNDAPQTLTRLMDMGIPPFEIAEVKLIISQRLVRCLCEYCKIEQNIPDEHLLNEGFKKSEIPKLKLYTHKPNGCEKCDRSGYNGRIGIFQVMPISEEMKRLIMKGCNSITLARQARSEGIPDLRESGLKKVKNGLTSLVELNQVVSKER